MSSERREAEVKGWVLYDGACGFCSRWVPFWAATLRRIGLGVAPLQAAWVRERMELSSDELVQDLRLLLSSGERIGGADVYRYAMKRIWWAYPGYLVSIAPICSRIFDWSYRTFAKNRYRISSACRLPAASAD